MKLLIASHNSAKVKEYKYCLSDLKLSLVSLSDLNVKEEVPENGKTFKENAIKRVSLPFIFLPATI